MKRKWPSSYYLKTGEIVDIPAANQVSEEI